MAPDDPYRSIAVRLLILQKDGIPEDAKAALRRELLAQGVVKPENEDEDNSSCKAWRKLNRIKAWMLIPCYYKAWLKSKKRKRK